jgi:hypothetical protein
VGPGSIHHAKEVCADCGIFIRWLPKPETVERQKQNAEILTALAKKPLPEWEREFVRTLATHKNISPKQQKILLQLKDTYLKGILANDRFNGESLSPD